MNYRTRYDESKLIYYRIISKFIVPIIFTRWQQTIKLQTLPQYVYVHGELNLYLLDRTKNAGSHNVWCERNICLGT